MTGEEILKMETGPELDRLVAEQIMGWREGQDTLKLQGGVGILGEKALPRYSTDIVAAMEVVERFVELKHKISMHSPGIFTRDKWRVAVWSPVRGVGMRRFDATSLPVAICRAALAVMEEIHAL